jgi:hypothetical protein
MKKLYLLFFLATVFLLHSCKMQTGISCPTFAGGKAIKHHHYNNFAFAGKAKTKKSKTNVTPTHAEKVEAPGETYSASANAGIEKMPKKGGLIKIQLPAEYMEKVEAVGKDRLNAQLSQYDKNTKIVTKGNKVYFQSTFKGMTKTAIKFIKPSAAPAAAADMDLIALLAGIFGIVAIVFAIAPYLNVAAFLFGVAALVMGILSLHSGRRTWALLGIILGAIAIALALIFILVYRSVAIFI